MKVTYFSQNHYILGICAVIDINFTIHLFDKTGLDEMHTIHTVI